MRLILSITQEEALKKLLDTLNTDYSPVRLMYGFGWNLDDLMYGKIENNEFWIYDRSANEITEISTCTQQLVGSIHTESGKTIVNYDFKYTKYNYYFFALLYLALIILSLLSGGTVYFLELTLTWLIGVSLIMGLGIIHGKKYKNRSISHFLDIFSDCIYNSN